MLEVMARDGAARATRLSLGPRRIETPGILWLAGQLPPGAPDWQPRLAQGEDANTAVIAVTRFTQTPPTPAQGQIVLARRLLPSASMTEPDVRLEAPHPDLAVWGDAYDLLQDPKRFVPALTRARAQSGHARALYAPGVARPHTLALLAYAGIDVMDATAAHYAAARGEYLTTAGPQDAARLKEGECACPTCGLESPATFTQDELAGHNQWALRAELGVVRNAIWQGQLRELVESRCRAHPECTGLLRRLDDAYDHFETRTAITRPVPLHASSKESLQRVECRRFRERVRDRYRPPTAPPVLLLLPCSHRKPYSKSRTHHAFNDAIWAAGAAGLVHEVILTSPLGLVPRELELTYPAAHYDVPVTGEWDEDEGAMIRGLLANLLTKRSYERVVSHLPRHTYELVRALLPPDTLVTCEGENATAPEALHRLELVLGKLGQEHRRADLARVHLERLRAIADYQFGPAAADALFHDAYATGKWPTGKLFAEGTGQLAMLPTERGLLSLTLAGGRRILGAGVHRVDIEDFPVQGSVFAVGVKAADPTIRPGDDVVVHHQGDLRAVGVARMSGPEMVECRRGEAVEVRHHA